MKKFLNILFIIIVATGCTKDKKLSAKGFQVNEIQEDDKGKKIIGLKIDSLQFKTRPRNVLLTKQEDYRLIPIYKVNYHKKTGKPFTGSNQFHTTWDSDDKDGNNWNSNFMPGFAAVRGYNLVNISHYNNVKRVQKEFFKTPVLVKNLYYPAATKDTLNFKPIQRNFYMVSVFDEDTNKDGFITVKDLRRFYWYNLNGEQVKPLVPKTYSVQNSEYDPEIDMMYIFARLDNNGNGQVEENEDVHVFWVDLKTPENHGVQYIN